MALAKNIEFTPVGFNKPAVLQNAYIKVDSITGNKQLMSATIGIYNKTESEMTVAKITSCVFVPKLEGQNFIAQAYEHLKTLPEFVGATDC